MSYLDIWTHIKTNVEYMVSWKIYPEGNQRDKNM